MLIIESVIAIIGNVVLAITETLVTPEPGLGHGRIASIAAIALWAWSLAHS